MWNTLSPHTDLVFENVKVPGSALEKLGGRRLKSLPRIWKLARTNFNYCDRRSRKFRRLDHLRCYVWVSRFQVENLKISCLGINISLVKCRTYLNLFELIISSISNFHKFHFELIWTYDKFNFGTYLTSNTFAFGTDFVLKKVRDLFAKSSI